MAISLGLRPRLVREAPGTAAGIAERIRSTPSRYTVEVVGTYVVFKIPEADQHYWSPQLQLELEDGDDGTVRVNGLITPMPAVWTLFACVYGSVVTLGFFGTIFGLAQYELGMTPVGLWSLPVGGLLLGIVYAAALIGQRIGQDQTEELTEFLIGCLDADPSSE